jgi:hypothetical protein
MVYYFIELQLARFSFRLYFLPTKKEVQVRKSRFAWRIPAAFCSSVVSEKAEPQPIILLDCAVRVFFRAGSIVPGYEEMPHINYHSRGCGKMELL